MNKQNKSGLFLRHESCPSCSSSDGFAIYQQEDGSRDGTCFVCKHYSKLDTNKDDKVVAIPTSKKLIDLSKIEGLPCTDLTDRKITQKIAEKYGVRVSYNETDKSIEKHYYPVHDKKGTIIGYKVRKLPKEFYVLGSTKGATLFGQNIAGGKGKILIITEGELDALAATQMFHQKGKNYRVVSLPTGANISSIKDNLEWVESFESVVLSLDQDEPGRKCAEEIAEILTPSKCKIMSFSEKDPCDMLLKGKGNEYYGSLLKASTHKPDGIVGVEDIFEEAIKQPERGLDWPWPALTEVTYGRRRKELYGFGAGSGCGKTEGFKEIIHHTIETDKLPVGLLFLEENPATTLKVIAGKVANKRFHVPDGSYTEEELKSGIEQLKGKVFLYNHFGQKSWSTLRSKIRYMVISLGIKDIFLDHLTALVADEPDVNNALGRIMADMASLTQELDFTLYYISHLSTPSGSPHEEGGRVTASQFRGSRTIMFWSHFLFGYERNQQAENEKDRNTTTMRILKDRYTGLGTGHTLQLFYDHETGRMLEEEHVDLGF